MNTFSLSAASACAASVRGHRVRTGYARLVRPIFTAVAVLGALAISQGLVRAQGRGGAPTVSNPNASASGDMLTPQQQILLNTRFEQKMGAQVPLDLTFQDESGKTVRLADYYAKGKPVALMLIFYDCQMLCSEVMNGTVDLLKDEKNEFGFKLGPDFEIVTVSINPRETSELAAKKKAATLQELGSQPQAKDGWHLLVGQKENIDKLADAIGYHYSYDPKTDQYAHPGGLILTTPQGKVSRYLNGIVFPPKDARYAMIESSHNKIGSPIDKVALFTCFHYNPEEGKYTVNVYRLVQLAAIATIIGIGVGIMMMRRWENKMRHEQYQATLGAEAAKPI